MLHGQTRYNLKSRFFDELPESALKWITPKHQGFASGLGSGGAMNSGAYNARGTSADSGFSSKYDSADRFAATPAPEQKNSPAHGLKSGMNVFHGKFGEGRVEMLEGSGDDARASINFTRHGVKWLALSVAKLTVI